MGTPPFNWRPGVGMVQVSVAVTCLEPAENSIILLTDRTPQVVGIDVYPYPVPEDIPPNLDFQVDDLNSP